MPEDNQKWPDSMLWMCVLLSCAMSMNGGEFPEIKQKEECHKPECASYREEHDMGKTIPYCEYTGLYKNFDCNDCPKFRLSERAKELMEMSMRLEKGADFLLRSRNKGR